MFVGYATRLVQAILFRAFPYELGGMKNMVLIEEYYHRGAYSIGLRLAYGQERSKICKENDLHWSHTRKCW